ncbi:MAG: histidine phosphatase family protein [Erysipelotrichaceae bacterium]|nr:histidine phosphatase family protein [Erysipelotrichaceae bacterium]
MIYYLVRHGQTDWNNEKRMQGHADIPLNQTGIMQINELAERIIKEGISFDRLIASPLARAKKSAEIIAEKTGFHKDILFDEDFIERDCGLLEGEIWRPELDLEDPRYRMETIQELCERAERALRKYSFSEDETIMIVSHGAILAAVRTVLADHRIAYFDRTVPVIQGNILCCVREEGKETIFYNLF